MNLAHLPWEQLLLELDRFAALPLAERKRQADGPGQGAPLDIFLHAARRIATTTDPSPARTLSLLAELGIDSYFLQRRIELLTESQQDSSELLTGLLAEGILDLAATGAMWAWEGIALRDLKVTSHDGLLQFRLRGQELLRWVAAQAEAPTLAEVAARLPDPPTRCQVLRWTTQILALVPGFCARRGQPTLGRPAMAYASRNRGPPVRPDRQPPHPGDDPGCALAEDVTVIVAELAVQPARARRDWVLRVIDAKRLTVRLGLDPDAPPGDRLAQAFNAAHMLRLVKQVSQETRVSETGLGWLRLDAGERQQRLLAGLLGFLQGKKSQAGFDDHNAAQLIYRAVGRHQRVHNPQHAWSDLVTAWRGLGTETWLLGQAYTWWGRHPPRGGGLNAEHSWRTVLGPALDGLAIPLGLIRRDIVGERATIRLTAAGRWAVGLDDDWTPAVAATIERPIIVQADHTIVFLAPAPAVEAELGSFADRLPGAHGTGALFKLGKAACRRAAVAGLDAAHALRVLAAAASKPVPANVEREITGWFGQLRQAHAAQALVITTADEDTATRLVALLGATRLGPQAVSLPAATRRGELQRRLLKDGILLNGAGHELSR